MCPIVTIGRCRLQRREPPGHNSKGVTPAQCVKCLNPYLRFRAKLDETVENFEKNAVNMERRKKKME